MLAIRIARRFIWRNRLQSLLVITGIALGIGTQLFVGSLISSLQASLLDSTVGSSAHVTLTAVEDGDRLRYDQLTDALAADPEVIAAVPTYNLSALLAPGDGGRAPLAIKSADLAALDTIYELSDRIVDGQASLEPDEILVGAEFAEASQIGPGDRVELTLGPGVERSVTVSGIFDLGVAAVNERTAFTGPDLAQSALDIPVGEADAVELQVSDAFASSTIADRYAAGFGVSAIDWQEQNAQLLAGLRSQSISSIMIQVFVVIAVGLGIASTLAITAVQKTRQIGILKALGMTDGGSGAIFLAQAGLLGFTGSLAGVAVGAGLIAAFDSAASGSEALFPVSVDLTFALVSLGIGVAISLLSAMIPFRATSRLDPIEVIQNA